MSLTERALSALERVSHELPSQRPLNFFIHHNPLHSYEHLPFCEGVERAAERWRANPWLSEERYRAHYSSARILSRDLSAVIADELPDDPIVLGRVRLRQLVKSLMTSTPPTPPRRAINWALEEGDVLRAWLKNTPREALERFRGGPSAEITLRALWDRSEQGAERLITQEIAQETTQQGTQQGTQQATGEARASLRWRRVVEELSGENIDLLVHPLLIKHCAAFLDVSFAVEGLPARGAGLLSSALALIEASPSFARPWLASLKRALASLAEGSRSAEALLTGALERTGVQENQLEGLWWGMVEALPGWPGMLSVLSERPELSPSPLPPLSLYDFFVLRLLLEESATRHALSLSDDEPLPPLSAVSSRKAQGEARAERVKQLAWGLFHAAQLAGVLPSELPVLAEELGDVLKRFDEVRRRRLWHLAFERRYRVDALDAFLGRQAQQRAVHQAPHAWLRVMTCIDDREESLRRHLEELDAGVETFGYAGFYGVAMFYQPLGSPHARALCPAVITPKHLVREVLLEGEEARWRARQSRHRLLGALHAHDHHSRRSPVRGTLNALLGLVSALPMTYRLLTPKKGAQLGALGRVHRETRLELERPSEGPLSVELSPERRPHGTEGAEALYMGFTLEERAHITRQTLSDMGLSPKSLKEGAPLTLCLGHGSRSINNPYEAGYQCGACGGGHGGASGRAFAQMANDPEVRSLLSEQGVELPAHVTFIGGAHDTCDDSVTLYDAATVRAQLEARLKASDLSDVQRTQALKDFEEALERALRLIDEARAINALERARRFELAPQHMSPQQALTHVEHRAHDLSEPRPEYNHATNALQIMAPRALTRGLFLDRRAFLTSYDHTLDPHGEALKRLLAAAVPVGAGINLEYFFSMVDPKRYGAGSKLPQNIVALLGVMDGHQSDLRTGLVWQMVEIHEPMRLLNIIVAPPARVSAALNDLPQVARLALNGWVQVAVYDPDEGELFTFERGALRPYTPERLTLPRYERSQELWGGRSEHLPFALITGRAPHMEAR